MIKTSYIYNAKITNVVDGDTVDAEVDLGFDVIVRTRFRLNGIDTPEKNSRDPEQRARALLAEARLEALVLGNCVTLETFKQDKYGRYLTDIYLGPVNVNQVLVTEGLAVAYFGGSRTPT